MMKAKQKFKEKPLINQTKQISLNTCKNLIAEKVKISSNLLIIKIKMNNGKEKKLKKKKRRKRKRTNKKNRIYLNYLKMFPQKCLIQCQFKPSYHLLLINLINHPDQF